MRKLILTLMAAFCFLLSASAQNRTVTGRVTNDKDAPLEGVNIATPDGKRATQTDKEGKFSLSVPSTINTLVFSYINFETTTRGISKNGTVSVSLKPSDSKLEEVVVVGYGTQKRREVTGSVATIKGQAVANKPVQSFEQALAGRAAGVQITVPSGVLNSPPVFRIRGTNTISLSSYPLVIVDGVPVPTGDFSSTNAAGNALASINPNDIESIDIAKDAAAAAIYGSRAANGVVFITTKKGKPGKAKVAYNGSFGFTNVFGVPEVLNAQQYTDYKNLALANNQQINSTNPLAAGYYKFATAIGPDGKMIDTKWADYVYRQGFSQDHNLNVSGASEFTSYYLSAGYSKQEGIIKANDFARKNILANIDSKLSKSITIGGKISYSDEFNLAATTSGSLAGEAFNTGGLGRTVMVTSPNISPYNNNGTYNLSAGGNFIGSMGNIINGSATGSQVGFYNPTIIIDKNRSNSETNHIQSNMYVQIKPISWLTLRSVYGIDYLLVDNDIFQTGLHGDGLASNGNTSSTYGKYKRYTWSNTAQFDYSIKGVHNISALAGQEQDRRTSVGFGVNRQQVSDPVYTVIQAGWGINNPAGSALGENYLLSGFGRLNYDYKKKYFISGNLRQDEYSALPGQKEIFWGASAGWDVAKEKFWSNLNNIFSSLKVRASFGKVGNTAGIGDFGTYSTYGSGLYGSNPTLVFNQAGNTNLKWETSKKSDIGASFGFIKDRLTFDVTYYKNDVSNLILNVPQSPSAGLPTTIPQNVGKMYNKGVELTINAVPVTTKNFTWNSNFNFSVNKNQVTELAPGLSEVLTASSSLETVNRTAPGYSVGSAWLVRSGGVDPATGSRVLLNAAGKRILYRNVPNLGAGQFQWSNEDGTRYNKADGSANSINQRDDAVMYNVIPKYVGGFSNNFKYKNFELDVLLTYQLGFYVYYGSNAGLHDQRFWNNDVDVLTAWKNPGDITTVPRPVYGDNVSNGSALPMDYNLFKGDFVKLKYLTIAYNIPTVVLGKLKVSNARFYLSGQNLAIITKYPGPDPEVSSNGNTSSAPGVDRNTIANGRTITAGINIGF
jgi:TonB-linked SusC/RagA family outer membrane protein